MFFPNKEMIDVLKKRTPPFQGQQHAHSLSISMKLDYVLEKHLNELQSGFIFM